MRQLLAVLSSFALLFAASTTAAAIKSGDIAILIEDAPVRRGSEPAGLIERGTLVKVREIDGLNISVDKPVRGQISLLNVVSVTEAEAFFQDKLKRDPNDVLMIALRGAMRYALSKTDNGMNDLNQAISLQKENGDLYYLRGKALLSVEKLREAKRDFGLASEMSRKALLPADKSNEEKRNISRATQKTRTARHYVAKGNLELRMRIPGQSYASSKSAFNNAQKLDPNYAPAYLGFAAVHLAQNQPDQALPFIENALELAPLLLRAHVLKGTTLVDQDKLEEAIVAYNRALEVDPTSIEAMLGRGLAQFYLGRRQAADADFDTAAKTTPTTLKTRIDRAQTFVDLGRLEAALDDLNFVVAEAPQSLEARNMRARAWEANHQYDRAIADIDFIFKRNRNSRARLAMWAYLSSLQTKKKDFAKAEEICNLMPEKTNETHLAFARLRMAQGKIDLAIARYEQVIEKNKESISGYSGRAMAYEQRGEYQKMLEDFRKCVVLDKDNPFINNNLAWILATCPEAQFRDGAEAVKLAQAACEDHMYRSPGALDTLAAAHAEAGNFEEALKQQKKAVLLAVGDDVEKMKARVALYEKRQPYREDNRKEDIVTSDGDKQQASGDSEANEDNPAPDNDT